MTGILTGLRNLFFSVEFLQDATCVSGYNSDWQEEINVNQSFGMWMRSTA